jgi:curved DNA-binding protein CbpA
VRKFFGDAVRDPYAVIGVAKNAEFIDVKKKYFKLVKEHHPDINQDDPDNDKVFRRI